jgi:hypothetical protein
VRRAVSGRCERTLTGHTRDVLCAVVLHGMCVCVCVYASHLIVYHTPLITLGWDGMGWDGVWCADGRVASGGVDGTIRVWGVGLSGAHPIVAPHKALVIRKHKHSVRCLAVLPGITHTLLTPLCVLMCCADVM